MATRKVQLTGIAEWAKVFEKNRDMTGYKPTPTAQGTYEKYNGACTIDLIMDEANLAALQASGSPKKAKPDPEGRGYRVKFDRKFDTGNSFSGGAPTVTDAEGNPWSLDTHGAIGNGSTVEIIATVYDVVQYGSVGTRLDSVRVIDHVAAEGGDVPVFSANTTPSASASSSPKVEEKLNDEILF